MRCLKVLKSRTSLNYFRGNSKMIDLIVGQKGLGKTKKLVELANNRAAKSDGTVVLITKESNLTFDLGHSVRLVNIRDYNISDFTGLYGFICGVCAGNYDVTDILIDSIFEPDKINIDELVSFIEGLSEICKKSNAALMLAVPVVVSDLPDKMRSLAMIKEH